LAQCSNVIEFANAWLSDLPADDRGPTSGRRLSGLFSDIARLQTWGETYEAAVRNAEEALAVYIETLIANGDPVPEPELSASPTALGIIVRTDIAA